MSNPYTIRVSFEGDGFTRDEQCRLLLAIEHLARVATAKPVQVLADRMGDDSRLRSEMTAEQRSKL